MNVILSNVACETSYMNANGLRCCGAFAFLSSWSRSRTTFRKWHRLAFYLLRIFFCTTVHPFLWLWPFLGVISLTTCRSTSATIWNYSFITSVIATGWWRWAWAWWGRRTWRTWSRCRRWTAIGWAIYIGFIKNIYL